MAVPTIYPVGYLYVQKTGVVSTYPQGEGLDIAVISPSKNRKPEEQKAIAELVAESSGKLLDDSGLEDESRRFQRSLHYGLKQLEVFAFLRAADEVIAKTKLEFRFNFDGEEFIASGGQGENRINHHYDDESTLNNSLVWLRQHCAEQVQQAGITLEPDIVRQIEEHLAADQNYQQQKRHFLSCQQSGILGLLI